MTDEEYQKIIASFSKARRGYSVRFKDWDELPPCAVKLVEPYSKRKRLMYDAKTETYTWTFEATWEELAYCALGAIVIAAAAWYFL